MGLWGGEEEAERSRYVLHLAFDHACVHSHFSCIQLFTTPWTVTHQAPLSMGYSQQEY